MSCETKQIFEVGKVMRMRIANEERTSLFLGMCFTMACFPWRCPRRLSFTSLSSSNPRNLFLIAAGECAMLLPVKTGSLLLYSGDPGIESPLNGEVRIVKTALLAMACR